MKYASCLLRQSVTTRKEHMMTHHDGPLNTTTTQSSSIYDTFRPVCYIPSQSKNTHSITQSISHSHNYYLSPTYTNHTSHNNIR